MMRSMLQPRQQVLQAVKGLAGLLLAVWEATVLHLLGKAPQAHHCLGLMGRHQAGIRGRHG